MSEPACVAVRNLRLCTKDCLCLYVCPTGATDTENSIIDTDRCLGCGVCAAACPSGAISMVPVSYPPQQPKQDAVLGTSFELAERKAALELAATGLSADAEAEGLGRLAAAIARATRLVNEDLLRESGYMLPQSAQAHDLLRAMLADPPSDDFPREAAGRLLELVPQNDPGPDAPARPTETTTYRCLMCGAVFEVPAGGDPVCPVCGARADYLEPYVP